MHTNRYFIINKPYNMESQFVSNLPANLLGDLDFDFPEGIHAIGRLDKHSEGLLILTTNKKITSLMFEKNISHKRTYLLQVKHLVREESLQQLRAGISIRIKGGDYYTTKPCEAAIVAKPENLFAPCYDINERQPYTWLEITLTEGKFHQVRKMVAAIRHKCQRLIRISIEDLKLNDLQPGQVKELDEETFFHKVRLTSF